MLRLHPCMLPALQKIWCIEEENYLKYWLSVHLPDFESSSAVGRKQPRCWWPHWLQRKETRQQAGYSALPAGISAGDGSMPESASAKPSTVAKSPFSDASQQQRHLHFADGYKVQQLSAFIMCCQCLAIEH